MRKKKSRIQPKKPRALNAAYALDKEESWIRFTVIQPKKAKSPLVIELRDNGCGIDGKMLARIFDPFYTTKPEGKGTGLGLYVSRNLIERLGGHIEVESELGKGSTLRVILPTINHLKNQRNNGGQLNGKFHIGRG